MLCINTHVPCQSSVCLCACACVCCMYMCVLHVHVCVACVCMCSMCMYIRVCLFMCIVYSYNTCSCISTKFHNASYTLRQFCQRQRWDCSLYPVWGTCEKSLVLRHADLVSKIAQWSGRLNFYLQQPVITSPSYPTNKMKEPQTAVLPLLV